MNRRSAAWRRAPMLLWLATWPATWLAMSPGALGAASPPPADAPTAAATGVAGGQQTQETNGTMEHTQTASPTAPLVATSTPRVLELRQYTLHPGQRDVLIDLFEREFVEPQEALGMRVIGTFRDLERPDRFVWLRGFADMPSRAAGLDTFYTGPVWKQHRTAANATMIDATDVLLLRPAGAGAGLAPPTAPRAAYGAPAPEGIVVATIYPFAATVPSRFPDFFADEIAPALAAAGITVRGAYVTETTPNNYPRLPVRADDHVFVWFASFAQAADYDAAIARLSGSAAWLAVEKTLRRQLAGPQEVLRLQATPRSELRP